MHDNRNCYQSRKCRIQKADVQTLADSGIFLLALGIAVFNRTPPEQANPILGQTAREAFKSLAQSAKERL
jgi:hypothetical protein